MFKLGSLVDEKGAGVVQEGVFTVANGRRENEPVRDVLDAVPVVVDLQVVPGVVGEALVIGPGRGVGQPVESGDHHRHVRIVGVDEEIHVRVVHGRVLGDQRRFGVARSARARYGDGDRGRDPGRDDPSPSSGSGHRFPPPQ
jgi:hypothetical protein